MTAPREGRAAVHAKRLEHTVAHEHAVVERRDARRGLGAPVTDAGGNVARTRPPIPTPSASDPRTVLTRWWRPGCDSTAHSAGTSIEPGRQTRPRSLRARSTIITFSARSLALDRRAAACEAVPLIGLVSTWRPCHRRKRSGDAETTPSATNDFSSRHEAVYGT